MKFKKLIRDWQDVEEYKAGDVIFSAGDKATVLYFLLSGDVELKLNGQSLAAEAAGGVFGEMAMMKSSVHSATAIAINDVKLARIDRKDLKKVMNDNEGFSFHVMATLARRLKTVDDFIIDRINLGQ